MADGPCSLFEKMGAAGVEKNVVSYSAVIGSCAKCGEWEWAAYLIQQMHLQTIEANTIAYDAGIIAFDNGGQWTQALALFNNMAERDAEMSAITYSLGILAYKKGGDSTEEEQWERILRFLAEMPQGHFQPDIITYSNALRAIGGGRCWQIAAQAFQDAMQASETWLRERRDGDYEVFSASVWAFETSEVPARVGACDVASSVR